MMNMFVSTIISSINALLFIYHIVIHFNYSFLISRHYRTHIISKLLNPYLVNRWRLIEKTYTLRCRAPA